MKHRFCSYNLMRGTKSSALLEPDLLDLLLFSGPGHYNGRVFLICMEDGKVTCSLTADISPLLFWSLNLKLDYL